MRLAFCALLLLAASCASVNSDIRTASRKFDDTNVRALGTYQWDVSMTARKDTTGSWATSDFDLNMALRKAVDHELKSRGYREVDSGADMRIALLLLASREETDAALARADGKDSDGTLTQGALLVDISHGATGRLLWRGAARSEAHKVNTPAEVQARIDYAVARMFEGFQR